MPLESKCLADVQNEAVVGEQSHPATFTPETSIDRLDVLWERLCEAHNKRSTNNATAPTEDRLLKLAATCLRARRDLQAARQATQGDPECPDPTSEN